MSNINHLNIRWFPCLVRRPDDTKTPKHCIVTECYTKDELSRKVIMSQEIKKTNASRRYAVFESHIDLYTMIKNCQDKDKCFHEVFISGSYQKPRFDIDIKEKEMIEDEKVQNLLNSISDNDNSSEDKLALFGHYVKDRVIDATIEVLTRDGIVVDLTKNIIVCSSHGISGDTRKASYHIIIDGYMHIGEEEARAFFEEVMKVLDENPQEKEAINRYIDHGVYNKNQTFRLLWNHKMDDTSRVKRLEQEFTYNGDVYCHNFPSEAKNVDHFNIMILEACMVTFTSHCDMLPPYASDDKKVWDTDIKVDDTQTQEAYELLKKKILETDYITHDGMGELRHRLNSSRVSDFENTYHPDIPFRVRSVRGTLIVLERTRPSWCSVCNYIHDKMDPIMFIINGSVYFDCRRSEDHVGKKVRQYLGKIEWHQEQYKEQRHSLIDLGVTATTEENDRWGELEKANREEKKDKKDKVAIIPSPTPTPVNSPMLTPTSTPPNSPSPNVRMVNPIQMRYQIPIANTSPFNTKQVSASEEVAILAMREPPKLAPTKRKKITSKPYTRESRQCSNIDLTWHSGINNDKNKPFM